MAISHLSVKVGRTGKAGPHAAYIAREGKYADRLEKGERLEATEAGNLPAWAQASPQEFWNAADLHERKNGTTYREFEVALPRELAAADRLALVREFIQQELGDRHAYQFAIHCPTAVDGKEQPHAHIMFSERQRDGIERDPAQYFKRHNAKAPEKGGAKKGWGEHAGQTRNKDERAADLKALRQRWEQTCNAALERAGQTARVDLRSHAERGINLPPERKMRPSEWRTRKAEVIEFRQARAELSKAVPDVAAEIVNLEQRRREADRPKTERTGPRISRRFDIKAQNEARERERREQEAEQEREQRDPAYRREKAERKLVEWNDEVMREKAKIVKQIRADTLEKARLHVEKWQAHIDSKPLLFFGEKARIWQKKDDEMDEQDSLNRRKLDEINEKGWPMNNDERAVVQQAAEQVAAKKPELARQAQAAHNLISEENWRERERQAQEQARTALEREFERLAANRAMKANGYTDNSQKWQATPKLLREIIDDYNSRTKEQQGRTLATWMRDPEKSQDIASMIEQHRENTRDRGMSR
jgi:hypothetical protein